MYRFDDNNIMIYLDRHLGYETAMVFIVDPTGLSIQASRNQNLRGILRRAESYTLLI